MSIGWPKHPIGVWASRGAARSGSEWMGWVIGESTKPGCTELTRIPSLAYWAAADLENVRTAPLEAW